MSDETEDIKKKLQDLGIPLDAWGQSSKGVVTPPILKRQQELLIKVRDLLQSQLDQDLEKVTGLHETLGRLKHGGGK